MKWRGPDKLTFPNRAERVAYINAHPVPDTWEPHSRLYFELHHPYDRGHPKITREHEGRPLRWCVACHVPLFHGWYCGQPCDKKTTACRAMVFVEEHTCHLHTPEKVAERGTRQKQRDRERRERAYNKRRLKEGKPPLQRPYFPRQRTADVQHITSTSQVRQIEAGHLDPDWVGEPTLEQRRDYRKGLSQQNKI